MQTNDMQKQQPSKVEIERQLQQFKKGFPFTELVRAATPNDGIEVISDAEKEFYTKNYQSIVGEKTLCKFVPASGAATRMFKDMYTFVETYSKDVKDSGNKAGLAIMENLHSLALYNDLADCMRKKGLDIEECLRQKDYAIIMQYILEPKGLNYGNMPKGLLKFHRYADDCSRTALEEHFVEGAMYAQDNNHNVNLHFTISPEHQHDFEHLVDKIKPYYEEKLGVKYHVEFSIQDPKTNTIAVNMDNTPYIEPDGSYLFRPAGHGALINNLNDIHADVIFIKNIDNVVPDRLKQPTFEYKQILAAHLLTLQKHTHQLIQLLKIDITADQLIESENFAINKLHIDLPQNYQQLSLEERKAWLIAKLNRPMRVCGMVKNVGEPGGGPFWVKNNKGEVSLQIVETSQIDKQQPEQQQILQKATHFNPVDLVCATTDYLGKPFNLDQYVDKKTGFISTKSKNGVNIRAMELPGLWNGAMADWITIFVEVPLITFNPVKTINDLLRPEHIS